MQSGSEEDFEKWQLFEIGHKDNVEQLFGSSQKPSVTSLWHKNYLRLKLCRLNKSYELKKVTNCLREGLSVRYIIPRNTPAVFASCKHRKTSIPVRLTVGLARLT